MNFFEQQDQSRRQTRWLVFLFLLAVLAIIVVVDLLLLVVFGARATSGDAAAFAVPGLAGNGRLLVGGALGTAGLVGVASLFKTLSLRGGGARVALELGGTRVEPDTRDPLKRRLVNVVEEIALASGVPVPEIYVLEKESGINAFAAGYSPADAVVAVTRGTLEQLSRNELQGVIAHEFSHIFNGDMRLNIRLMGVLFGILVLSIIGRRVLYHSHHLGRSRDRNGAVILLLALAFVILGHVGLFFGRWIKAAVSRQREYLADASAVQFTRDPDSIAGALKKIAVYSDGSYLEADSEEVGHMLFGQGRRAHLFATHPPLLDRIRRIEPDFQEAELKVLGKRLQRARVREAEQAAREQASREAQPGPFDAARIIDAIGNPDMDRLLVAAALAASLPDAVDAAAHSVEMAREVLVYSLLHADADSREQQLLVVAGSLGGDFETRVRHLVQVDGLPSPEQRLPLLEMALPSLRRHPGGDVRRLLEAVDRVIRVDGRIEVFEYLMVKMIRQYLWEAANPHAVRAAGGKSLRQLSGDVRTVLAVLAAHSHTDVAGGATVAYQAGMRLALGDTDGEPPGVADWVEAMDSALPRLDRLSGEAKERLVAALIATVTSDGQLVPTELELMRVVCAMLHIPIPALLARPPA